MGKELLLQIIKDIINCIFLDWMEKEKTNFFDRIRTRHFIKKLNQRVRNYIISHDGTILTTGDFEAFLRYHHLLETIFEHIVSSNGELTRDAFIKKQIAKFHNMQKNPENNRYDTDDVLKEFIDFFYSEIELFYRKRLPNDFQYLATKGNEIAASLDEIKQNGLSSHEEIMRFVKLAEQGKKICDSESVYKIFSLLYSFALNGKVDELIQLKPLLAGKNDDIELSVSYLINLLTNDSPFIIDFKRIQSDIIDDRIFDDVARFSLYLDLYRNQKEVLFAINDRNKELFEIATALRNNNKEQLYSVEKEYKDGISYYSYSVENDHFSEKWIIHRICILELYNNPCFGISGAIRQIISEPRCFLDNIIILDSRVLEIHNKTVAESESIREIYEEERELENETRNLSLKIRKNLFCTLLRTAILLPNDEASNAIKLIPDELKEDSEIEMLILEIRSRIETIELKTIVEVCEQSNEYWLFHNYLIRMIETDPVGTKHLIEDYKTVIENSPSIFLMYISLVSKYDEIEKARELLETHEETYGDLLEFKLEELNLEYNDAKLTELVNCMNKGEYKRLSIGVYPSIVRLLMEKNRFDDALLILNGLEKAGMQFPGFQRYKLISLYNVGRENEALEILLQVFESGDHSSFVVYYILLICFNNKKIIPDNVLLEAEKSNEVDILNILSFYYENNNNHDAAILVNLKALLRTKQDDGNAFGYYIGLRRNQPGKKEEMIQISAVDTVIRLKDDEGNAVSYAIYKQGVLPEEPYSWENLIHVSQEYAIKLGIFRKKINESLVLDDLHYSVIGIESLDSYLYRVSMGKLLKSNKAKTISLVVDEDGKLEYEATAKRLADALGVDSDRAKWREEYKDLEQIPMTFNIDKMCSNATYFQIIRSLLYDPLIFIREEIVRREFSMNKYVFSHAALIVLQQIKWIPSLRTSNYAIAQSLLNIAREEQNETINRNNQEHVATMNVEYDRFFFSESSEGDKTRDMNDAIEFYEYCQRYTSISNHSDLHLEQNLQNNIKQILGAADYDAFVIAKNDNRVFVGVELMHSGLCSIPELNIETMCIAEFLSKESSSIDQLFKYIYKMIELRFMVPFTASSLIRIAEYCEGQSDEIKKDVLEKWKRIIEYCDDDDEYTELIIHHLRKEIAFVKTKLNDLKSIYIELLLVLLKASDRELRYSLNTEKQIHVEIVKVDEKNTDVAHQE